MEGCTGRFLTVRSSLPRIERGMNEAKPDVLLLRPSDGNRSMELTDPALRDRVRELTFALVGQGEAL